MARIALTVAVILMTLAATAAATASPSSRCFGAASRDPQHPCRNPALELTVTPSADKALLTPSAPCQPIRSARPKVCAFGSSAAATHRRFASIGDSHSEHWRAALSVVAHLDDWHGAFADASNGAAMSSAG